MNANIKKSAQIDLSSSGLSHLDSNGDINMVDVSGKIASTREANAIGQVRFPEGIYTHKSKRLMA